MTNEDRSPELNTHFTLVADAILKGRVVPFLGAGVNLSERPRALAWSGASTGYPPSGSELADYLAQQFHYPVTRAMLSGCPDPMSHLDLARISQYGVTLLDEGPLNDELRAVFGPLSDEAKSAGRLEFQPTAVHRFLAGLRCPEPRRPQDKYPLIVTTNYDDLMEQALGDGNFDLVFYKLTGKGSERRGSFWHKDVNGIVQKISDPSCYPYEFFNDRTVVLKVHGSIDRTKEDEGTFVITEDHYIEYISEEPMERLLPPRLLEKMRVKHHLLFLGYSLRDWNFRVFLRRLNQGQYESWRPWAVLLDPNETERKFWEKNGVDIINSDLKTYVDALRQELTSRQ
jgi:SIR2-like protein